MRCVNEFVSKMLASMRLTAYYGNNMAYRTFVPIVRIPFFRRAPLYSTSSQTFLHQSYANFSDTT